MRIDSAQSPFMPLTPTPASGTSLSESTPTDQSLGADATGRRAGGRETNVSAQEAEKQRQDNLELTRLAILDRQVRAHEQAHAAVGGAYAGAPSYSFTVGPNGKSYAVSGEVSIDTSGLKDPKATIGKLEVVVRAALAPADPSAQDQRVAAQATARISQARAELAQQRREASQPQDRERGGGAQDADEKSQTPAPSSALDIYRSLTQISTPGAQIDLSV